MEATGRHNTPPYGQQPPMPPKPAVDRRKRRGAQVLRRGSRPRSCGRWPRRLRLEESTPLPRHVRPYAAAPTYASFEPGRYLRGRRRRCRSGARLAVGAGGHRVADEDDRRYPPGRRRKGTGWRAWKDHDFSKAADQRGSSSRRPRRRLPHLERARPPPHRSNHCAPFSSGRTRQIMPAVDGGGHHFFLHRRAKQPRCPCYGAIVVLTIIGPHTPPRFLIHDEVTRSRPRRTRHPTSRR